MLFHIKMKHNKLLFTVSFASSLMLPISCNDNVQEKDEFHQTGADLKSVAVFRIR